MVSILKSTEITTDEGSDKQIIYETSTLPSIYQIKIQLKAKFIIKTQKQCRQLLHMKYSKDNQNYMLDPVTNSKLKKKLNNNFKEMMVWRKTNNNIKK